MYYNYYFLYFRAILVLSDVLVWFNIQILGFLLMLVVMLYNGWMVIVLILGSTTGYFIFGPRFMKINLENCQTIRETFCSSSCPEPGIIIKIVFFLIILQIILDWQGVQLSL